MCQTEKTEIKFQAGSTFGRPLNGLLVCSCTDQISYTPAPEITIRTEPLVRERSIRFSSSGTDVCLEMLKRIFKNSSLTSLVLAPSLPLQTAIQTTDTCHRKSDFSWGGSWVCSTVL